MLRKALSALLIMTAATFAAPEVKAQEVNPGIFQISKGQSVRINRHNVCRVVKNVGSTPVMVSAKSPNEWSQGSNSFLNNIATIPNVTATECPPRQDDRCFFWVSGLGAGRVTKDIGQSPFFSKVIKIGTNEYRWMLKGKQAGSSIVGEGDFRDSYGTDAKPGLFYEAHNGTFDSLAVGPDTTVAIYFGKDFQNQALRVVGPKVITNAVFKDRTMTSAEVNEYLNGNCGTSDPILRWFPVGTRSFISDGQNSLFDEPLTAMGTGSVKVECKD